MSQVPVWFERKFEFSFPVEQHPNLCVRLRGTPVRLEEMLREAPHDLLVRRPRDKWSAQEHAGHLLDLESLWMARVDDFLAGGETLTAADLSNRKTHERRADRTEARLADANINPRTGLATDYLNHFNEAVTPQAVVDGLMQRSA